MKKSIFFALLVFFFVFLFSFGRSSASFGLGGFLGGKIIHMKALEIEEMEDVGFECAVPGKTITILPIGSPAGTPKSYFISSATIPKTRTTPMTGQFILGKYSGKTTITCILKGEPPMTGTAILDVITMFGTSKF